MVGILPQHYMASQPRRTQIIPVMKTSNIDSDIVLPEQLISTTSLIKEVCL